MRRDLTILIFANVVALLVAPPNSWMSGASSQTLPATAPSPLSGEDIADLKAGAEAGDADAQAELGARYGQGDRVTQDLKEALKWTSRAAEQGNGRGLTNLGNAYRLGLGVDKDMTTALKLLTEAADKGVPRAEGILSLMYLDGDVPQDDVQALKWARLSADKGDATGQLNLAWVYRHGIAVSQDYGEAFKWFRLAALQQLPAAQYMVGWSYATGQGVDKDSAEAEKWFRQAADQGYADAQYQLGRAYLDGYGHSHDPKAAITWLTKAANQGEGALNIRLVASTNPGLEPTRTWMKLRGGTF